MMSIRTSIRRIGSAAPVALVLVAVAAVLLVAWWWWQRRNRRLQARAAAAPRPLSRAGVHIAAVLNHLNAEMRSAIVACDLLSRMRDQARKLGEWDCQSQGLVSLDFEGIADSAVPHANKFAKQAVAGSLRELLGFVLSDMCQRGVKTKHTGGELASEIQNVMNATCVPPDGELLAHYQA